MEEYRRKEQEKNALLVAKVKDQITAESSESEDEGPSRHCRPLGGQERGKSSAFLQNFQEESHNVPLI